MKFAITLESLQVLHTVAQKGSFSAAAKALHRVPSSITYAISQLEQRLGVTLFDRNGHQAQLTIEGEALLRDGRDLLSMANGIEQNVRRIATGWEAELRIAVGDIVPIQRLLALCERFYDIAPDTRLKLTKEVLGGTWDALVSDRADLVIGAPGDAPPGGGHAAAPMGELEFVFVIAPHHPLATQPEPLSNEQIRQHRGVAAADTSQYLSPRTFGLLPGQSVLTVPDLQMKREVQLKGLGVGRLPYHLIAEDIAEGRLIVKETEDGGRQRHAIFAAWRTRHPGNGLSWFREQLTSGEINWFE